MTITKTRTLLYLTASLLFIAAAVELVIELFFPEYRFKGYWGVPLFFWVFYACALLAMPRKMNNMDFVKFNLGIKAVKMFTSLCFATVAAFFMREHTIAILFNFIVYYLLLLVPECIFFIHIKKHINR